MSEFKPGPHWHEWRERTAAAREERNDREFFALLRTLPDEEIRSVLDMCRFQLWWYGDRWGNKGFAALDRSISIGILLSLLRGAWVYWSWLPR